MRKRLNLLNTNYNIYFTLTISVKKLCWVRILINWNSIQEEELVLTMKIKLYSPELKILITTSTFNI